MRVIVLQIPSPEVVTNKKIELSQLHDQAERIAKEIAKLTEELRIIEVSQALAKATPQQLAAFAGAPAPTVSMQEWLWREQWADKSGFWTAHGHTARKLLGYQ